MKFATNVILGTPMSASDLSTNSQLVEMASAGDSVPNSAGMYSCTAQNIIEVYDILISQKQCLLQALRRLRWL